MSAQSDELRVLVNEPVPDSDFTDSQLDAFITAHPSMNATAAHVWRIKAGRFADLVNITEGNSSRSWSNAYKQALDMVNHYERLAEDETSTAGRPTARSRKITRS